VWQESSKGVVLIKPHLATHAILNTAEGKKAVVAVADLDTLQGVKGMLTWMRLTKSSREILGRVKFDGIIEDIKSDYGKRKRK
jgi:hypothetical protein